MSLFKTNGTEAGRQYLIPYFENIFKTTIDKEDWRNYKCACIRIILFYSIRLY